MVAKSNSLNASQFLLLILVTLASFTPMLANAQGKTFEVSNNIKSAKAIVGSEKKLEGRITFDPKDNDEKNPRNFDLTIGECKFSVKAEKKQGVIGFDFKGEGDVESLNNPDSFSVDEKGLTFKRSKGGATGSMNCGQDIKFVPMEGDSGNFTLEVSLAGDIPDHFALTSKNLIYEQSPKSEKTEGNGMPWLYIGIGIAVVVALLVIALVVGLCICKCRKKKAAAAKGKKSSELAKVAVSAENSKMGTAKESKEVVNTAVSAEQKIPTAKEVSEDQKTKEQTSAKDKKSLKAKKDQKPAKEQKPDAPQVNTAEEKPDALDVKTAEEKPDPPPIKLKEWDILRLWRNGRFVKVKFEVQPTRHHRKLTNYEEVLIEEVKNMLMDRTNPYNVDEAIWIFVEKRDKELAKQDRIFAEKQAEERARMRTAEEREADLKTAREND